jgi:flagellar biosynthesis/type III secretory pathway protein FliH
MSQGQMDGILDAELPGKLEDAEIQRLVMLSQATEYQRSERVPVKAAEAFEPRSLVSIAMDAQRRRDEELRAAAASAEAAAMSVAAADAAEAAGGAAAADGGDARIIAESETGTAAETQDGAVNAASAETGNAAAADGSTNPDTEGADTDAADTDGAGAENQDEAVAGIAASTADFDAGRAEGLEEGRTLGFEDGHAKGMAEGRAAGSAEASAQLERAIQAFETATASLKDLTEVDSNALSASIRAAILQLASARAGQVISDMPAAFVSRIEGMISKIRTVSGEPVIRLNSADLAAVAPLIETREKLRHCHFVAENDLASGDLSVTVGNIGIDDFLLQDGGLDNGADNGAMSAEQTQPSRSDASGGAATIEDSHQQDTNDVTVPEQVAEQVPEQVPEQVAEQVAEPVMTGGDAEQAAAKPETSKGNAPESDAAEADESLGDVFAEGADAAPADPAPADPELADLTPADMPSITAETAGEADDD